MTIACLTFDFDAVSLWVSTFKQTTSTPISRGEFGANVGLPRVMELLDRKGIKATFFVPAQTAASFPEQAHAILNAGHEIGVHGYCHENPIGAGREAEAGLLDRAIEKLRGVLGAEFYPRGYRSPAWDISNDTVDLLVERNFLYDSSMMGSDFSPYRARRGDRVDEHLFRPGPLTRLIELPVAWELDDFPYFTYTSRPLFGAMRSPEDVLAYWVAEFDYCHQEVDEGVFTLTMHPQVIGRGPRIRMLERLIEHVSTQPNVSFCTLAEAAKIQHQKLPLPS